MMIGILLQKIQPGWAQRSLHIYCPFPRQSVEAALKMIPDVLVRCMTIMAPAWILSGIREAGSKPMSSYLSCTDGCKDPDAPQMIFRFGKAIEQSGTHR